MGVLWWLAVPLGVTVLAMAWAAWVGRPRDDRDRDEVARARLADALAKPMPAEARRIAVQPPDPPRGVAVRRSTRTTPRRPAGGSR
ncbi:MAG TPA: hypothetical protein VEX15_19945 [Nocardioidaceae bacterium]|nr:hypothetical protein [Nocardioidaceae bacterium]